MRSVSKRAQATSELVKQTVGTENLALETGHRRPLGLGRESAHGMGSGHYCPPRTPLCFSCFPSTSLCNPPPTSQTGQRSWAEDGAACWSFQWGERSWRGTWWPESLRGHLCLELSQGLTSSLRPCSGLCGGGGIVSLVSVGASGLKVRLALWRTFPRV